MSDMDGNPDYWLELMDSPDARSVPTMLGALVHEQRTANLIEVWKWHEAQGDLPDTSRELYVEIVDRLGLDHS